MGPNTCYILLQGHRYFIFVIIFHCLLMCQVVWLVWNPDKCLLVLVLIISVDELVLASYVPYCHFSIGYLKEAHTRLHHGVIRRSYLW
jgi:hypothetical protein